MEFLKIIKRRSFINEVIYVVLNIGLSLSLLILVRITNSVWPAFLLVLISKWRVFAVRPQFWFANIQANIVSTIVSVSYVVFLYLCNRANLNESSIIIFQLILAALDSAWLLLVKPRSKRKHIVAQASIAMFVGISALYAVSYGWIASPVVIIMWLIGYASARHVLSSFDEDHTTLLSLVWGFVMAEIGWVAYHWTMAYRLPIAGSVFVSQVAIVALCLSFVAYVSYNSYHVNGKIRIGDIILPLIFAISVIGVLVIGLNSAIIN